MKKKKLIKKKKINCFQQGGGFKLPFEEWYKTVPKDRNDTIHYNLRGAYDLAPIKELEEWRKSSIQDLKNGKNHLRTVYEDPETGVYHFMKDKDHPTINMELDFYNSEEGKEFRNKYELNKSNRFFKYIPKKLNNIK